ncbi:MAG: Holliday junction resolvase RuvX [Ignavibacteriae bacterium]|nr:Holliday junction resolvase RuvX [Ignavibacteriota bacterium]
MTLFYGRILGIDYGSKRIGVAVSDPLKIISQGVGTLENDDRTFDRLKKIITEREIDLIVVGMPYTDDGGKGKKALEVDAFIESLIRTTDVGIVTWDESFSSVNAQRSFIDGGMKKKQRRQKQRVDEMAARLMLQDYLDHRPGG